VIAVISALDQTEGKLIAAREDKDAKGVSLQTKTYRHFEEILLATANEIHSSIPHVVQELQAEPSISTENIRAAVRSLQMYGLSASFKNLAGETSCFCSTLHAVEKSIKAVDPTTIPSPAELITVLANGLMLGISYIQKGAARVLTGGSSHIVLKRERPAKKRTKSSHKSK